MKNNVYIVLVCCIVSIFTNTCYAFDLEYSSYDEDEIDAKLIEWIPEGWNTGFLQAGFLEGRGSLEYIIWHISKVKNTPKLYDNQLFVFSYVGEKLALVWKSDVFEGHVINMNLYNLDNNELDNINLILAEEQNDQHIRSLRSYDWNKEITLLVYPQDHLPLFYGDIITVENADRDTDIEIVVHTCIQDTPLKYKVETYTYKNSTIQLERETIEPKNTLLPVLSDLPVIAEADKPFDDFLRTNGLGFLLKSYYAGEECIYILDVGMEEIETDYNKYIVVKKEHGIIKLLYKIDKAYNDTTIGVVDIQDMNLDGDIEVIFRDTTTVVKGALLYIISLSPHNPRLISPLTDRQLDNGRYMSDMYLDLMRGPLSLKDLNDDGVQEIGTTTYYNDDFATQYWIWDKKYRVYAPYKLEVWDEATNSFVLINQPADI